MGTYQIYFLPFVGLFFLSLLRPALAQSKESNQKGVQVIFKRGVVLFRPDHNNDGLPLLYQRVKYNLPIPLNSWIKTGKKSAVRLKLETGRSITLGPESEVQLSSSKQGKISYINLLKGRIRAKFAPDKNQTNGDHKAYIKTNTASLGVRGTDFLVVHNDENQITSTLTFKGQVDVYKKSDQEIIQSLREQSDEKNIIQKKINTEEREHVQQMELKQIKEQLGLERTQKIPPGKFSGAYPGHNMALNPVKISPTQFDALNQNHKLNFSKTNLQKKKSANLNKKKLDTHLIPTPEGKIPLKADNLPGPEPKSDLDANPGGILDLDTGIYISPSSEDVYDEKEQVYKVSSEFGEVDPNSGAYIPPEGLKLDPINGFVALSEKFNHLTEKLNRYISQGIYRFKEITRLDLEANVTYSYTTNLMENYYGERQYITNSPAMFWDLSGKLGHQTFNNRRYLWYPKVEGKAVVQNRRKQGISKRNDYSYFKGGIEFHRKFGLFDHPARFIIDTTYQTLYRDHRNRNTWDFYTENVNLKLTQRFSWHTKHQMDLFIAGSSFEGYQKYVHGNIYVFGLHHEVIMGRRWDMTLGGFYSRRLDQPNNGQYNSLEGTIEFIRKNIFRKTDVNLGFHARFQEKKINKQLLYTNWAILPKIRLDRRKGDLLVFSTYYSYHHQESVKQPSINFRQHELGIRGKFLF